jgi:hypothetical protein
MARRRQAALAHLAEARDLAAETEECWFQAETLRQRGEVLLATGDPAAAEASYREAMAIAQRQSATLWELCAAMSLARLWRDQGKGTAGRELLAPVYGWFSEGFGTPVLQEAKALLEELADVPALPENGGLAAAGATDRYSFQAQAGSEPAGDVVTIGSDQAPLRRWPAAKTRAVGLS